MNSHDSLQKAAHKPVPQQPVRERGGGTAKSSDHICHDQEAISPPNATLRRKTLLPGDHQMREVDCIVMRWSIGTMVEAELAVVTFIDDLMMIGRGQLGHVTLAHINPI